jgi:hypothetical protein
LPLYHKRRAEVLEAAIKPLRDAASQAVAHRYPTAGEAFKLQLNKKQLRKLCKKVQPSLDAEMAMWCRKNCEGRTVYLLPGQGVIMTPCP